MLTFGSITLTESIRPWLMAFFSLTIVSACSNESYRMYGSVHQLRIEPERYEGQSIIVKGFLSRSISQKGGAILLYATKDDAEMRNLVASVLIDLSSSSASSIEDCLEHFVEVAGIFQTTSRENAQGELGITDLEWMKILTTPTSGLEKRDRDADYCVDRAT